MKNVALLLFCACSRRSRWPEEDREGHASLPAMPQLYFATTAILQLLFTESTMPSDFFFLGVPADRSLSVG